MSAEPRETKVMCACPPEQVNTTTGCAYWTWDQTQQKYVVSENHCKPGYGPVEPAKEGDRCDPVCNACAAKKP